MGVNNNNKQWSALDNIVWFNVLWFTSSHLAAIYGIYLSILLYHLSLFGITAGVHRLWSHRAYKAVLPLRAFLAICNSIAYHNSIYEWTRDHRVHHKFTETDADPVNSKRGFFFCHTGWLMARKHPDVKTIGGKVDLSDIMADPVARLQKKYYTSSVVVLCFLMPTVIPWYYWSESLWNAYFIAALMRWVFAANAMDLVNSAAHMWGQRSYDSGIAPTENIWISIIGMGEGYHNYHHTFPFDYRHSEWGWKFNLTTMLLDVLAMMGLVYDRRFATEEMIKARKLKTGPKCEQYTPQETTY